jgi:2-succinyl-5-enolpyruvyl-6-hydroxy-3-cyclohexene-1-carboxylate synthase
MHSNPKILKTLRAINRLSTESLQQLKESWLKHNKKLVVFGVFPQNEALNALAQKLAQEPDVVVLAENLSNISGNGIITQLESLYSRVNSKDSSEYFAPDLLITIGHSVICKQLKIFLRGHKPSEQWQIESSMPYVDTYKSLTSIVPSLATDVLSVMPFKQTESHFSTVYQSEMTKIATLHNDFVNNKPLSDMKVTVELLKQTPAGTVLHLANSTSVRWTQLFPARKDLNYICNRGTSGIDGSLSTAAGYAYSSQLPSVFLTGDLSFIYDSNALWNNYIGKNLKIIVMNNNGGNIFRFIGDKELMEKSLDFFTTPHQVKIESLVEAYGLDYIACDKTENLENSIENLLKSDKATVLEVFTDSNLNTENYKGYFKNIKK